MLKYILLLITTFQSKDLPKLNINIEISSYHEVYTYWKKNHIIVNIYLSKYFFQWLEEYLHYYKKSIYDKNDEINNLKILIMKMIKNSLLNNKKIIIKTINFIINKFIEEVEYFHQEQNEKRRKSIKDYRKKYIGTKNFQEDHHKKINNKNKKVNFNSNVKVAKILPEPIIKNGKISLIEKESSIKIKK